MLIFFIHFLYWIDRNAPVLQVYKTSLSSLNEEYGEIVFSLLATANLSLNDNGFNQLKRFYTMLNCYNVCLMFYFNC